MQLLTLKVNVVAQYKKATYENHGISTFSSSFKDSEMHVIYYLLTIVVY